MPILQVGREEAPYKSAFKILFFTWIQTLNTGIYGKPAIIPSLQANQNHQQTPDHLPGFHKSGITRKAAIFLKLAHFVLVYHLAVLEKLP